MFFRATSLTLYSLLLALALLSQTHAHADCTEKKISYETFTQTAQQSGDLIEFLQKLPPQSMSNVTLMKSSQSFKSVRESISPEMPGVIRGTANSKLIFRYVCDDSHQEKNHIEVMRFEDEQFKFSEIYFGKNNQTRVVENPASCKTCHENRNPQFPIAKPIWKSYRTWPEMYGSDDDFVFSEDKEARDFYHFVLNQASNDCYRLSGKMDDLYLTGMQKIDLQHRPNLRFSTNFGLLYARAMAHQIEAMPGFKAIEPELRRFVFSPSSTMYSDHHRPVATAGLRKILREIGLTENSDFNLLRSGDENMDKMFLSAIYGTGKNEIGIVGALRTQLAEYLSKHGSGFKDSYTVSRGVSANYGLQYSCMDDLGGELDIRSTNRLRAPIEGDDLGKEQDAEEAEASEKEKLDLRYVSLSETTGFQHLIQNCAECHTKKTDDSGPLFMKDLPGFQRRLSEDRGFRSLIRERITSKDSPMPPYQALPAGVEPAILEFLLKLEPIQTN